jgi:hypothetical protein
MKNKTSHMVRIVPKSNKKQNIPQSEQFQNQMKNKTSQSEQFKNLMKNKTSNSQYSSKI